MIQVKIIKESRCEDLEKSLNTYLKDNNGVGNNLKDIKFIYDKNSYVAAVLFEKTKTWESNSD